MNNIVPQSVLKWRLLLGIILSRGSLGKKIFDFLPKVANKKRIFLLCSYKLRKKHIKYIKEIIKNNNDIRMKDLHLRFIQKFKDVDISRQFWTKFKIIKSKTKFLPWQYLSKILRDNNITRKRATFEHFPTTYRGPNEA